MEYKGPMNFEVNGVTYYLIFNQDDNRWAFVTPVGGGFRRIPVSADDGEPELDFPEPHIDDGQQTVN